MKYFIKLDDPNTVQGGPNPGKKTVKFTSPICQLFQIIWDNVPLKGWTSALRYTYYMITRQFNATHLFIMTGLQSHFIVNDFKIGCICSTNFAPFPHQLSKILCTLFSSTKLSVLRTIEKHCMGTIWLLGAKLWTDFQTITSRNDFLDRWYHWTTLSVQKIIVNHNHHNIFAFKTLVYWVNIIQWILSFVLGCYNLLLLLLGIFRGLSVEWKWQ